MYIIASLTVTDCLLETSLYTTNSSKSGKGIGPPVYY